ncbi:MAG: hypothetical protein F4W92_05210 [Gammaproteobacteria bacterium]|nr:hypothetical protein [Gammaproteobacteria bacterium]
MQPTIPIDRGVLKDEQLLTPWRSPDMEGANPADFLSVCQSANATQTTNTTLRGITQKKSRFVS